MVYDEAGIISSDVDLILISCYYKPRSAYYVGVSYQFRFVGTSYATSQRAGVRRVGVQIGGINIHPIACLGKSNSCCCSRPFGELSTKSFCLGCALLTLAWLGLLTTITGEVLYGMRQIAG